MSNESRPQRRSPWQAAFAAYAWLQFLLLGLLAMLVLLSVPTLARRRRVAQRTARLTLRLAGMRWRLRPGSALPSRCIVVANHCSYLDGAVLTAALPPRFSFVIKREMARVPLAGLLLRRIGVEFMERRAAGQLLRDTRRMLRHASAGQALVFFPEGTFDRRVGLLRFHIGAFAAAARAGVPVVPVAIHGTRHCLAPGGAWPRPGRIEVEVLAPLAPPPPSPDCPDLASRARWLCDRARAALLTALQEPDLDDGESPAVERRVLP